MFMLRHIIAPFLLPPGIFISILLIASLWFFHKNKWKACIVTFVFAAFSWALSISPVSDAMISGLESGYRIPKIVIGDVIILLGHGVMEEAPDLTGIGAPSSIYLTRIVTAVRLQKKLHIPIIVSGAEVPENRVVKGHIAKRFLMNLGVPADKIIIEDKSRVTFENAKFTEKICHRLGFTNPILVTSAYHMKRAVMTFSKLGLKVLPIPCGFRSWGDKKYNWKAYLPGNFVIASIAIREYLGLLFYDLILQ